MWMTPRRAACTTGRNSFSRPTRSRSFRGRAGPAWGRRSAPDRRAPARRYPRLEDRLHSPRLLQWRADRAGAGGVTLDDAGITGTRTFYRIVWTDLPTLDDFLSRLDRGVIVRVDDSEIRRLASSISVFRTLGQARRNARKRPATSTCASAAARRRCATSSRPTSSTPSTSCRCRSCSAAASACGTVWKASRSATTSRASRHRAASRT